MDVRKSLNAAFSGGDAGDVLATVLPDIATIKEFAEADPQLQFNANTTPVTFGQDTKLTIKAGAHTQLKAFAKLPDDAAQAKLLADLGLQSFFGANPNRVLVTLDLGGEANLAVQAKNQYTSWQVGASLEAGADARLLYARAYQGDAQTGDSLLDFFRGLASTATLDRLLAADEVIVMELGGYLKVGAEVSAGWKMNGTRTFGDGPLEIVEQYGFALAGGLSFNADLAGRFRIDVRAKAGDPSKAIVTVRKQERRAFGVAADVNAGATFKAAKVPGLDDVVSSLIGVQPQNWLNLIAEAEKWTDPVQLKANLDRLAEKFILEWTDKAAAKLDDLTDGQLQQLLAEVKEVAERYKNLDKTAVALFDRFFDENTKGLKAVVAQFNARLDAIPTIADFVKQTFSDDEVEILDLLTGGRVSELVQQGDAGLATLKQRLENAINLDNVQAGIDKKIRDIIVKAKSEFPLDGILNKLATVDFVTLKNKADQKLIGLVERWIGKGVDALDDAGLGKVAQGLQQVRTTYESFRAKFKKVVEETLTQSFSFALHAAYNRASSSDTLLQLELDLTNQQAFALLRRIGRGDVAAALAPASRTFARILSGTLIDEIDRRKTFNINVVGWHGKNWQFNGVDTVLTNVTQRVVQDGSGGISIDTTATLTVGKERQRQGEKMMSNFIIDFVGESASATPDPKRARFLIDQISGMSASYDLSFSDNRTTETELRNYLAFADDFGLAASDQAAFDDVTALVPRTSNNEFGAVQVKYDVAFDPDALKAMFSTPLDFDALRKTMRRLLLWSNVKRGRADIGWAYWTGSVYQRFKVLGGGPFVFNGPGSVSPDPSPFPAFAAPVVVSLDNGERNRIQAMYAYEDRIIAAIERIGALVQAKQPFTTEDLRDELDRLGSALSNYDSLDAGADNTIFAIFDACVRQATGKPSRSSSLRFEAKKDNASQPITRMLLA